jgi:hypothetical protein
MAGKLIFLMMTECPLIEIATVRFFSFWFEIIPWIVSTTAVEFINAPSTMASEGSGAMEKLASEMPFLDSFSWTSLMELDPMSRPSAFLPRAIGREPSPKRSDHGHPVSREYHSGV